MSTNYIAREYYGKTLKLLYDISFIMLREINTHSQLLFTAAFISADVSNIYKDMLLLLA
jgi:hypothetical protein